MMLAGHAFQVIVVASGCFRRSLEDFRFVWRVEQSLSFAEYCPRTGTQAVDHVDRVEGVLVEVVCLAKVTRIAPLYRLYHWQVQAIDPPGFYLSWLDDRCEMLRRETWNAIEAMFWLFEVGQCVCSS